jgi:hypothetical protein
MKNIKFHAYPIFLIAFPVAFLFTTSLFFAIANAADVTLAWDANTESDLAGYKLYYDGDSDTEMYQGIGATEGDSPIIIYSEDLSDGDSPSYTITGLEEGQYYYFSLTAFDADDVESDFSDEVGVMVDSDSSQNPEESGSGCFISDAMASHSAGSPVAVAGICLIFGVVAAMKSRRISRRAQGELI